LNADVPTEVTGVTEADVTARVVPVPDDAITDDLRARYLGDAKSAVYLIRPDQHVAARWADFDTASVRAALRTACGME
jgi:3-(3-hydroxy-phenyl)propionate hydroxylase